MVEHLVQEGEKSLGRRGRMGEGEMGRLGEGAILITNWCVFKIMITFDIVAAKSNDYENH
jgi:hypothetical protein